MDVWAGRETTETEPEVNRFDSHWSGHLWICSLAHAELGFLHRADSWSLSTVTAVLITWFAVRCCHNHTRLPNGLPGGLCGVQGT